MSSCACSCQRYACSQGPDGRHGLQGPAQNQRRSLEDSMATLKKALLPSVAPAATPPQVNKCCQGTGPRPRQGLITAHAADVLAVPRPSKQVAAGCRLQGQADVSHRRAPWPCRRHLGSTPPQVRAGGGGTLSAHQATCASGFGF